MLQRASILILALLLIGSECLSSDEEAHLTFLTERTGSDFILVKYNAKNGQVWFVNEKNRWQEVAPNESKTEKPCQYAIIVYETIEGGGRNPLGGVLPTRRVSNWTLVRTIKESGKSSKLQQGRFVEIEEMDATLLPKSGEFRLVSTRVGNSFAIYRFHAETGKIWSLKDNAWTLMEKEQLPGGNYKYLLIAFDEPQEVEDGDGGKKKVLFSLMRVETRSGKSWTWSVASRKFVEIPEAK